MKTNSLVRYTAEGWFSQLSWEPGGMPSFPVLATTVAQRNLSLKIPNGDNTLEKEGLPPRHQEQTAWLTLTGQLMVQAGSLLTLCEQRWQCLAFPVTVVCESYCLPSWTLLRTTALWGYE